MAAKLLIIGRAGRLRDGLSTILRTFPGVTEVTAVDDFESALDQFEFGYPSAVIVDGDERLENECLLLKRMLFTYTKTRCIVIANTLQQRNTARKMGANAVLPRGFSTSDLYRTLLSLALIPNSGYIGQTPGMIQSQTTAVLNLQRP